MRTRKHLIAITLGALAPLIGFHLAYGFVEWSWSWLWEWQEVSRFALLLSMAIGSFIAVLLEKRP